jgi:hypothetical protein
VKRITGEMSEWCVIPDIMKFVDPQSELSSSILGIMDEIENQNMGEATKNGSEKASPF